MAVRILAITIVAACGVTALGQGVDPGTTPTETTHVLQLLPPPYEDGLVTYGASIGTWQSPLPVELDPHGPTWISHFSLQPGDPIPPMAAFHILEGVVVTGSTPWTGWHVRFGTGGLEPGEGSIFSGPSLSLYVNNAWVSIVPHLSGDTIDATFPSLQPGTKALIALRAVWFQDYPFTGSFDLSQYPTPEPSGLALFGFTAALLVRRRHS